MVKLESVTLNDYENILVVLKLPVLKLHFISNIFLSDPVILKKLNNFYDILVTPLQRKIDLIQKQASNKLCHRSQSVFLTLWHYIRERCFHNYLDE